MTDGNEAMLRALEEAEAQDIERQVAPETVDAIVEPYCEVEDVAENIIIDLLAKAGTS